MDTKSRQSAPFRAQRSMRAAKVKDDIFVLEGVGAKGTESILDVSNLLWAFNTISLEWHLVQCQGDRPSPRRYPGFVSQADRIVLWGGSGLKIRNGHAEGHTFESDLWHFSPERSQWTCVERSTSTSSSLHPAPRYFPVFENLGSEIVCFGGYGEENTEPRYFGDTWRLSNGKFEEVFSNRNSQHPPCLNQPAPRYGAMAAVFDGELYVFGGYDGSRDRSDLWRYSPVAREWSLIGVEEGGYGPSARYSGAVASNSDSLVLFGGRSRKFPRNNFSDLWRFDIQTRQWHMITGHSSHSNYRDADVPAYHAKSAYCSDGRSLWVLGGEGASGHVSDFWRLDLSSLGWELIHGARPDDPVLW